jgi:hypothetical protein
MTDDTTNNNMDSDNADEEKVENLLKGLQAVSEGMENHKQYFNALKSTGQFTAPATTCKHGLGIELKDLMDAMQPVHFYIKMCEAQRPGLEYDAFVGYFGLQRHALSEQSVNVLQMMAVSAIKENATYQDYTDARMYLSISTKLRAVLQMGGTEEFVEAVQFNRDNCMEEGVISDIEHPHLRSYYQAVEKICSNSGLVQYLIDLQLCHCLDGILDQQSVTCDGCLEVRNNTTLNGCSQCHEAKYHSKSCQRVDWKEHKRYCKKLVNIQNLLQPTESS